MNGLRAKILELSKINDMFKMQNNIPDNIGRSTNQISLLPTAYRRWIRGSNPAIKPVAIAA
jgi:hypothetical protein